MAATSSATTTQVQAQPRLMRSVSQIPGKAEGTTIRIRILRSLQPQGAAEVDEIARHPLDVVLISRTCWKKVPIQMMRNFCASPVPDQRMVSGTKATTGM